MLGLSLFLSSFAVLAGDVVNFDAELSPQETKLLDGHVDPKGIVQGGVQAVFGLFQLGAPSMTQVELDLVNDNILYGLPDAIANEVMGHYPSTDSLWSGDDVGDTSRLDLEMRRGYKKGSIAVRVLSHLYTSYDAQNGNAYSPKGHDYVDVGDLTEVQVELVRDYGQRPGLPPRFFLRFTVSASELNVEGGIGWKLQHAFHKAGRALGFGTVLYEAVPYGQDEFTAAQYAGVGKTFRLYQNGWFNLEGTVEAGEWLATRPEFNRAAGQAQLRGCLGRDRALCLSAAALRSTNGDRSDRIDLEYRFKEADGSRCSSLAVGVESAKNIYTRRYPSVREGDNWVYNPRYIDEDEPVYRMKFKKCF